jgi:rhodanese-related sulfurtransferase
MNYKKYGILNNRYLNLFGYSLTILFVAFFGGCWKSCENKQGPALKVINVLDKSYFDDCHIKGSVNIPFDEFEKSLKNLSKNDHYVLYCSNYACTAAPYAAQLMKDMGFAHVALFPGGVVEWYQKGLPCNGACQLQYLKEDNPVLDEDAHGDLDVLTPEQLQEKLKEAKLIE